MSGAEYREEFLNPAYWHPKCKYFEIIDWDKFSAQNPSVPKKFNPPQRKNSKLVTSPKFSWWNRSKLGAPPDGSEKWGKTQTANIDDPNLELLKGILGPNPDSSKVPEPFRNSLLWMEGNEAPEELVSFNRAAWRSNTKEGRAVGLSDMQTDWTNSPNAIGAMFSQGAWWINFQVSPDGKWIKLFVIKGDATDAKSEGTWLTMYVVQEGDEFTDRDDNILTDVNPGDIYRVTFEDKSDPYECDHEKIVFSYITRKVAVFDEETGEVKVNSPYYERLVECATSEPPKEIVDATDGLTNDSSLTTEERWDIQVKYISNSQKYNTAPAPPPVDLIENISATTAEAEEKGGCAIL